MSLLGALAAHLAVLSIVAVASTVIIGGELSKWWRRRRDRPLG